MKRNGTLSCGRFEFPGLDVPGLSGRPVPPAGFKGRRPGGMLRRATAGALPRRARAPAPRERRAGPRLPLWAGGAPAGRLLGPAARPRWRRGRCRLRVAAVVPGPCARPHTSLHRVASPRWTRLGHLVPGRAVGPACDPAPSRAQCANSRAPWDRGRLQGGPHVPADPGLAPASPWAPGRGQGQEGWRRPAAQCPGDDAALPEAVTSWGLCEGGPGWPLLPLSASSSQGPAGCMSPELSPPHVSAVTAVCPLGQW